MTHAEAMAVVQELTELAAKTATTPADSAYLLGYIQSRLAQTLVECPSARVSTFSHIQHLKNTTK